MARPRSVPAFRARRCEWRWIAFSLACLLDTAIPTPAAERVWDGSGRNADWTEPANWTGLASAPVAGDSLRFPAGALKLSNNNDFPTGTSFNLLTYAGAGYTASGNEIGLTGGIVVSHGAGNTVLNLPINVALNQTFMVSVGGANLFLNGTVEMAGARTVLTFDGAGQTVVVGNISDGRVIVGGGTIRKNGPGTLYVLQNLTLGGPTIVNGGTLIMDGRMSNSAVTVNASATLRGTGKVGGLTVNSGGTVGPGLNSPDILDSLGDVALNAGSTLNIRLNGTSVGLNYDQLKVQGAVTLGGTLNVTAGFVAAVGDTFTIIENDGTDDTVGTFAGLPEGAILTLNGRPFKISYGGRGGLGGVFGRDVNDVTLEAVPALAVWDGGGGQNKFWSTPQNWVGDVVPMPGDDMQFSNSGTTINDFPPGRVLGSMIFAGGAQVEGTNQMELHGDIQVTQPGNVYIPMPLTLNASQHFRVDDAETLLKLSGDINVGNHSLVIDATGVVNLVGTRTITGTGNLVKNGSGSLVIAITNSLPLTTVNAGTLVFRGRFLGKVVINPGARLEGSAFLGGELTDVEAHGGIFAPYDGVGVRGSLRMLEGSTFIETIDNGPYGPIVSSVAVGQEIELNNCNFSLIIASLPFNMNEFPVLVGNPLMGTFNGLPEGKRFVVDGRVVDITYTNGVRLFVNLPFVWDGGGNGNGWTAAANWRADFAPLPDFSLVFPAGVSKVATVNDFAPGTRFSMLSFLGPSYTIFGNSFSLLGGIFIDSASGETLIRADITLQILASPNEFRVGNSSTLRLEGSLTGGPFSVWQKTGTGTLRLGGTAANTQYRFDLLEGELELAKPPGTNAISGDLVIGDGTNSPVVRLLDDHQIADTAEVEINRPARFELNGNLETIGKLEGNGTVELSERLQRLGRLTVESGNFSGSIIGGGGLTKVGASTGPFITPTLRLTGNSSFTGPTVLSDGLLIVEGVQTNSPIRLDGGVLTGRGFVGTITGGAGGLLDPGQGGGVVSNALHSRSVALNSSITFRAKLLSRDPGFENHKLQVTGSVSLGGSALDFYVVYPSYFVPASGDKFVIIENDGTDPVMGTFAGLPEGTVFTRPTPNLRWRISYAGGDGNDVMLTLVEVDLRPLITSFAAQTGSVPGTRFFKFTAFAVPNAYYDVEASTDLMNWTRLFSVWVQSDGILGGSSSLSQPPFFSQRFFRFKQYPLQAPGAEE